MPSRYEIADWEPWKSMKMHRMPVDHFVDFYLVDADMMAVTIIRIVYGGRDLRNIAESDME